MCSSGFLCLAVKPIEMSLLNSWQMADGGLSPVANQGSQVLSVSVSLAWSNGIHPKKLVTKKSLQSDLSISSSSMCGLRIGSIGPCQPQGYTTRYEDGDGTEGSEDLIAF